MSEINRVALFGKLNSLGYKAIEGGTVFCKLRGNPYVELLHWFQQILQQQDSDLHRIIRHFQLDPSRLAKEMTEALDRLPRGATSILDLSPQVEAAAERGWVHGSQMFGDRQVRSGHLVVGILKTPDLSNALLAMSREFEKVKVGALVDAFDAIVGGSPETSMLAWDAGGASAFSSGKPTSEISRVALFGKLNRLGYKAIESATALCKLRGNPYVELVHWFQQILQQEDSDLHRIIRHFQLDPSLLAKEMTDALVRLPGGATSIIDLSSQVEEAVERGWVYGSLMFGDHQVRTGHLVVGIMKTPGLRNALPAMSREFEKVKVDTLVEKFDSILGRSPETSMPASNGGGAGGFSNWIRRIWRGR